MKIRIFKEASAIYMRSCYKGAPASCGMLHNPSYYEALKRVEGCVLDVETDYLFTDQFNTEKLRIMANVVTEVIDDERIGKIKSGYTGRLYSEEPKGLDDEEKSLMYRFVEHPNKIIREAGIHVYELYYNNPEKVMVYEALRKG